MLEKKYGFTFKDNILLPQRIGKQQLAAFYDRKLRSFMREIKNNEQLSVALEKADFDFESKKQYFTAQQVEVIFTFFGNVYNFPEKKSIKV